MLLQAPIIAILMCLLFDEISSTFLFTIVISAIWLGIQNAAREITSEHAIYKRERMYNLHIFSYIFSKISVLLVFAIIQSAVFVCILTMHYNNNVVDINNPILLFFWMVFISVVSTFLGLLLSSMVKNTERAMTILPLILLPQILFAGLITSLNNFFVEFLSYFTIYRWGVEGVHIIQEAVQEKLPSYLLNVDGGLDIVKKELQEISPSYSFDRIENVEYTYNAHELFLNRSNELYRDKEIFGNMTGTLELDFFAMILMILIFIIYIYKSLINKDTL